MLDRLAATLLTAALGASGATPVVHRGQVVHLRTTGPVDSRGACAAQVNYIDGFLQQPGVRYLYLGHVTFVFRIPSRAAYGPAQWTVRCGLTLEHHGTWRVAPR